METRQMNCKECQIELPAYVDGSLAAPVYMAVEAHVAACAACTTALAGERRALAQFAPRIDPILRQRTLRPAARNRIAAAGRRGTRPAQPWWHTHRSQLAAAALLILAGAISSYLCQTTRNRLAYGAVPATTCSLNELTNSLHLLVKTACQYTASQTFAVNTVYRTEW